MSSSPASFWYFIRIILSYWHTVNVESWININILWNVSFSITFWQLMPFLEFAYSTLEVSYIMQVYKYLLYALVVCHCFSVAYTKCFNQQQDSTWRAFLHINEENDFLHIWVFSLAEFLAMCPSTCLTHVMLVYMRVYELLSNNHLN